MLDFTEVSPAAKLSVASHGARAKCLQRLIRLDLPVPRTLVLPFATVRAIAAGKLPDMAALAAPFGAAALVAVRSSPQNPEWGGPSSLLNVGMSDARAKALAATHGAGPAEALYLRFIRAYAVHVARLDEEAFAEAPQTVAAALQVYEAEMDEPFPQSFEVQLREVLRSMARAWEGTSARLLRQARGAPPDAGLGLVIERMALGVGRAESGAGLIQFVSPTSGEARICGRYLAQSQGRDALAGDSRALYLAHDARGPSLEDLCPDAFARLRHFGEVARRGLREEMQLEFTIEAGRLSVIDAAPAPRSARAAVAVVTGLAEDEVITRGDALLRIAPQELAQLLHPQVRAAAPRDVIARGIAASPGAAAGRVVFSATAAQAMAAQGESCILVRRETSPEDIRGMHAASGVLTEHGGMTSHAAVIARGLGVPCVAGASGIGIDLRARALTLNDGRVLGEGDVITVDGTHGEALMGATEMLEPAIDGPFRALMDWADEVRDIGVRANADTPADARVARNFSAEGIGLCRTEHMFFEADRLTVMREMIFTDDPDDRRAALDQLLPMQRDDFVALFEIMQGRPVCIRLFDPPLHEFLPHSREGMRELAEALDLPASEVTARVEALQEFNPMLGMRGVRLGITVPEIYDMQTRAIFEATLKAGRHGAPVVPEIMIPLVSARREVELVKARIDAVAAAVSSEQGTAFDYRLGVMVETPRAALCAGRIAEHAAFLSFGTNDLTQMTYGLSRDDAGRFMSDYVKQGVFEEDPFHTLDTEGVGELMLIAAKRGREARPDLVLSVCGEHGGNADSIAFCRKAGLDYVSCSPYRVPAAKLAAAQHVLRDERRKMNKNNK